MIVGGELFEGLTDTGEIVIYPYDERQAGPNSYDIRLGNWFAILKEPNKNDNWPYGTPATYYDIYDDNTDKWQFLWIADGTPMYIHPHQMILAHSYEFIGGRGNTTTKLHCRSTIRRSKGDTNAAAGYGDRGYVSRWTLELKNDGEYILMLYPGQRVAQMEFLEVHAGEGGQQYSGKYGFSPELWTPMDMLPKGHKDWDKDLVLEGKYKTIDLAIDRGVWIK